MGRRRAQLAAMTLLSSAAPSATGRLVSRRLGGCAWRRSLTTSAIAATASATARPRRSAHALAHGHSPALDGRRFYASTANNANIAVVGGGLTGLTTAYYLAKKLPSTTNITLYEANDRLGGWIRTERHPVDIDGKKGSVLFERGPRSLTSLIGNYWRFDDLVLYDLCLDLGLSPVSPWSMPRYIYYPDHLVPVPPHISLFDIFREPLYRENILPLLTLSVKSLFSSNDPSKVPFEDLPISEWIYRLTNSRESINTFTSSMIHGIYGGDVDKLSARTVLDRLFWGWYLPNPGAGARPMPQGEIELLDTLGQDKQIQKMASEVKSALLDFGTAGMQSLPDAISAALKDQPNVTIKLNTPVKSIRHIANKDKVEINYEAGQGSPATYDKVISTTTADVLAQATQGELPSLAKSTAVDVMTVNLWFPKENIKPPGTGYLIPRNVPAEANPEHALGVFFDGDVQQRGPDEPAGTKLFVLMGGHYYDRPGVSIPSEAEAIVQARTLLERHLDISRDAPCYAVSGLAKKCIPQHNIGHQERMREAHRELRETFKGRLAVAGGSYTRIGAVAALRAGYDIATRMTKDDWRDVTGVEDLASDTYNFVTKPLNEIAVRGFKPKK